MFCIYLQVNIHVYRGEKAAITAAVERGWVLFIYMWDMCHVQVFKEEEEAIKVDLHGGRTKLFWVTAVADSKTLKAMAEFHVGE